MPIDNNHIEKGIRPIAVGRKNGLFAGSLQAGQRMTGIMCCRDGETKRYGSVVWLRYVLNLPVWKNNRLDEPLSFAQNPFIE